MAKRVLRVDDNITNSDWVKANAFDFPGVETVEDFERALDVPVSEPARTMRLQTLAQLPWAKVTPEPIYELLFPSATTNKSLIDLLKASFGGDRSAAGRYAAEQRWKGHKKQDKQSLNASKDAIIKSFPKMMQVKSKPWWLGDTEEIKTMVELTFSDEVGEKAFSGNITLADYGNPALAGGNCGIASAEVASFLIQEGLAKEGEVFMREVDEPWYGQQGGTHFVTHIGPKDSDDAIIVDITLRQFDSGADFPWIGTVKEYRAQGYEDEASLADGVKRPQMNDESFDMVLASGEVVYPGDQSGSKADKNSE